MFAFDAIIVGAGISGIYTAYRLQAEFPSYSYDYPRGSLFLVTNNFPAFSCWLLYRTALGQLPEHIPLSPYFTP